MKDAWKYVGNDSYVAETDVKGAEMRFYVCRIEAD